MRIFYINIEKFKYDKSFLEKYSDGKSFKTEKRFYEYTIGRYLVKKVAKEFYKAGDVEIVSDKNSKPILKNSDIYFSISHSNKYIAVCFDDKPCGFDIEFIKPRSLKSLEKRYNCKFKTLDDFYIFWTQKEAVYKLHQKPVDTHYALFNENYYFAIASTDKIKIESIDSI